MISCKHVSMFLFVLLAKRPRESKFGKNVFIGKNMQGIKLELPKRNLSNLFLDETYMENNYCLVFYTNTVYRGERPNK